MIPPARHQHDQEGLQRAIDAVGRDNANAKASERGYTVMADVPMHIWWQIVSELRAA